MASNDKPLSVDGGAAPVEETASMQPAGRRGHDLPEHIGPFRIIEIIGQGGMGVVYKAEQRDPVRRVVALKVIKLGMDTHDVVARFEAERQALAMMSHPNVARVFEAGVTEQGRPYFAMEYVPGIPLTDYCDQNRLTTRERLDLFISVCQAVGHAHQKGIIHRDLKPGNILVSMFDGKPIPKVIDFGIAKAANQALTQKTLFTQTGALIGTPEYMSPEQAQTSGLDVDTRTDIYSLGVILYELLTGQVPFDSQMLRKAGMDGMARIIRETEPPKPSTRLSLAGHQPSGDSSCDEAARKRRSDPRSLLRELRGDLDWITLKAMEKDRTRRYDSAGSLAEDIRHYLDNEPVSARPPSTAYRLNKMLHKHKVGVAAVASVALALILGVIGTTVGMLRARADRNRAVNAEKIAIDQRKVAEEQRALAMESEARADSTIAHLLKMKGDFAGAEPMMRRSLELYRQLRGPEHVDVAAALDDLAWLLEGTPKSADAVQAARDSLAMYQRLRGEHDPLVASAYDRLGMVLVAEHNSADAELALRHAVEIYGALPTPDPAGLAAATGDLGLLLQQRGETNAAEPLLRQSLAAWIAVPGYEREMRHDVADIAQTLDHIAEHRGDTKSRMQFHRQYLIIQVAHIGMGLEASPNDIGFRYAHAQLCFTVGRFSDAMADWDRLAVINPGDEEVLMRDACAHLYLGDVAGYQRVSQRMLDHDRDSTDAHARDRTAKTCLLARGAVQELTPVLGMARTNIVKGGPTDLPALYHLCAGMAEYRAGNFAAASGLFQQALDLGLTAEPRAAGLYYLAMAHFRMKEQQKARDELADAQKFMEKEIVPADAALVEAKASLQDWLICQIARREAEALISGGAD